MSGNREKKKRRLRGEALTVLPLYVFTLLFVLGPIVYMIVLSFLTRAETWGVLPEFTLQNYKNIAEPVYLETFWESIKLALTSTVLVILIGYPFGYFMAKLTAKWKKRTGCSGYELYVYQFTASVCRTQHIHSWCYCTWRGSSQCHTGICKSGVLFPWRNNGVCKRAV